jgi:hypothetical protein
MCQDVVKFTSKNIKLWLSSINDKEVIQDCLGLLILQLTL